jgi:hypothetical protein
MFLAVFLLRIPIYGLLLWYLLTPEVRLAFAQEQQAKRKSADIFVAPEREID